MKCFVFIVRFYSSEIALCSVPRLGSCPVGNVLGCASCIFSEDGEERDPVMRVKSKVLLGQVGLLRPHPSSQTLLQCPFMRHEPDARPLITPLCVWRVCLERLCSVSGPCCVCLCFCRAPSGSDDTMGTGSGKLAALEKEMQRFMYGRLSARAAEEERERKCFIRSF